MRLHNGALRITGWGFVGKVFWNLDDLDPEKKEKIPGLGKHRVTGVVTAAHTVGQTAWENDPPR